MAYPFKAKGVVGRSHRDSKKSEAGEHYSARRQWSRAAVTAIPRSLRRRRNKNGSRGTVWPQSPRFQEV